VFFRINVKKSLSRAASIILVAVTVACLLLNNNLATTAAYYSDTEIASSNSVQAWTASLWTQTYEADFNAGVLNDVDTASYPDDVVLTAVESEPTASIGTEQSWYYSSWSRRAPVTITNTGTAQTDYQVSIDVTYDGDMQTDFDDIRFVDSDGITPLAYCSEIIIDSTSAVFWVKIPSIPSGSKTIYMYYGNPTADNACDGDATFLFYDNFPGSSINGTKWSVWSANVSVSGSVATIDNTGSWGGIASQTNFTLPYRFICRVQKTTTIGLGQAGLEHWYASTGDDTLHALDVWGGGRQEIYYTSKYDGSDEWDEIGTWNLSTWYHIEIQGETDRIRYYRDGGLRNDEINTSAIPTGAMEVLFSSASNGDQLLVDYCFVSKYVDPEPTASVGAEDGWSRYAPVTINNPLSSLTDHQVRVDVPYDSDMQSDFDDIRFYDSDGMTPLAHWRESYTAATSAIFWVKIPSMPSGSKLIYIYYGDSGAGTASDGDGTFEFYDDFEDGDISDWAQYGSGIVQIANDGGNMVLLKTAYNDSHGGYSLFNNGSISDFEVTFRTKRINENGGAQNRYGIENGSFNGYGPRMYDFNSLPSSFGIERRTGGSSGYNVFKSTSAYEWNTWMTVVFRKVGNTLEFDLYGSSGSLVESISTTDSTYSSFDRFVVHGGWEFYTDDIRVRKLAIAYSYVSSGTLASQVLDTGTAGTTWDGLFWDETLMSNTDITMEVRASDTVFNAGDASPSWIPVGGTSPVITGLPAGRYKQWRVTLTTSDTANTPTLHEVRVYYY
jgi:hypothetical protein